MTRTLLKTLLLSLFLGTGPLQALSHASPSSAIADSALEERSSIQVVSGALFSPVIDPESRQDVHYIHTNVRSGSEVWHPIQSSALPKGRFRAFFM
jgi:hypothetical protein